MTNSAFSSTVISSFGKPIGVIIFLVGFLIFWPSVTFPQMQYINCNSSCATTKVGGVSFANQSGDNSSQWDLSQVAYEGLASEGFIITDPAAYVYTDADVTATNGGSYTVVDDPSSINGPDGNPLAGGSAGGTLVFATNDTQPFAYYEIEGLEPGGQYCVQLKMRNLVANSSCNNQMWTRAQFRSLAGIDISGGGLSGGTWNRESGADGCNPTSGGWDGNNQTSGVAIQGMASTYEINFTLGQNPNNSTDDGFRIYFSTNSFQPNNVLGIDGIEVFGCITQEISSSNGDEICEGSPTTLTAMGIGSETDTYVWREGGASGTILPYTGRSFEAFPQTTTTYWVQCQRTGETLLKTIDPVNCCGPSGLFTIPKVCVPITANGFLDESVWNVAPWQDIDAANAFGISAAGDCVKGVETQGGQIAQWRAVYDDENAYFYIRTYDDNPRNAGTNPWFQDGVEIYIDRDGTPLQYGYTWTGDGQSADTYGSGPDKGTHVIQKETDYWDVEVTIPLAANNLDFTSDFIRMELAINQARDGEACRSAQIFSWTPENHYLGVNGYHVSALSDCASVVATEETVCNGGSTMLSTQLMTENTGQAYTWEMSVDGGNSWSVIVGESDMTAIVTPTIETQYRAVYDGVTTCPITIFLGNIDVDATPTISDYCVGETFSLTGITTATNALYGWRKGDVYATSTFVPGYNMGDNEELKILTKLFSEDDQGTYYFVVDKDGCEANVAVEVTGTPSPTIESVVDNSICGAGEIDLSAIPSAGTVRWYSQQTGGNIVGANLSYSTPLLVETTTYYVEAIDGNCVSDPRAPVIATVNPLPSVVLPQGVSICGAGETVVLEETGGDGVIWLWVTGDNTATITDNPIAETSYTVTVTDAADCNSLGEVLVQIGGIDIDATPALSSYCVGAPMILSGSTTESGAGVEWGWRKGADYATSTFVNGYELSGAESVKILSKTFDTGDDGNYYFVVTKDGCESVVQVQVALSPTPIVNGVNGERCGPGVVNLSAIPSSGIVNWYDAPTGGSPIDIGENWTTPILTESENYFVEAVDGNCVSLNRSEVNVTVFDIPIATLPPDYTICTANPTTTIVETGGDALNWEWSVIGESNSSIDVTLTDATTFVVTVTGAGGCMQTDEVVVRMDDNLSPVISGKTEICVGESTDLTVSGGQAFLWDNGSTDNPLTVAPTDDMIYYVTASDNAGCVGSAEVIVIVNELPSIVIDDTNGQICEGETGELVAFGAVEYLWDNGQKGANMQDAPLSPTTYSVTGTDVNGCLNTGSGVISVNPIPAVSTGPFDPVCENGVAVALNAATPPGGGYSGPGVNGTLFNPAGLPAGEYEIKYAYTHPATGCENSASSVLAITTLPAVSINEPSIICEGVSIVLTPTGDAGEYVWQDGDNATEITVSPLVLTNYSVTLTDVNGCSASAETVVDVIPTPQVDFTAGLGGCAPVTVEFHDGTTPTTNNYRYTWDFGDPSSSENVLTTTSRVVSHTFNSAGIFDITLHVAEGAVECESSKTIKEAVTVSENPLADFNVSPELLTNFNPNAVFTDRSSGEIVDWDWVIQEDEWGEVFLKGEQVDYAFETAGNIPVQLTVVTAEGCENSKTKLVPVASKYAFYAPTAFSPNTDRVNDLFEYAGVGIYEENFEFFIYNRWGDKIFEAADFGDFWNGKIQNGAEDCPQGVYTWLVRFQDLNNESFERNGKVTVIR